MGKWEKEIKIVDVSALCRICEAAAPFPTEFKCRGGCFLIPREAAKPQ